MENVIINQERIKKLTLRAQIIKLLVFSSLILLNYHFISSFISAYSTLEKAPSPLTIVFTILIIPLIIETNLETLKKRKIKNWLKNLSTEDPHLTECLFQTMDKLGCGAFSLIPVKQVPFLHLFSLEGYLVAMYNPRIFAQLTAKEIESALAYKMSYFENKHHLELKLFRFLMEILAVNIIIIVLAVFKGAACNFPFLLGIFAGAIGIFVAILLGGYSALYQAHQILDEIVAIQVTKSPQVFISMIKKALWAEYYKKSPNKPFKTEEANKLAEESSILKNQIKRIEENFLL